RALTSACRASSKVTVSALPPRTAAMSGGSPAASRLGSTPAFSSLSTEDRVTVLRREGERRHAVPVLDVGLRAGANQQIRKVGVIVVSRPMERRRAVRVRRIHIRSLLEQ